MIVNIKRVTAIDQFDPWYAGEADFYAVVYAPEIEYTGYMSDENSIQPRWFLRWQKPDGPVKIWLEIWDSGSWPNTSDDQADINPLPGRRTLQFTVNTQTNQITGDINGRVGQTLTLRGADPTHRAEIEFQVLVRP